MMRSPSYVLDSTVTQRTDEASYATMCTQMGFFFFVQPFSVSKPQQAQLPKKKDDVALFSYIMTQTLCCVLQ